RSRRRRRGLRLRLDHRRALRSRILEPHEPLPRECAQRLLHAERRRSALDDDVGNRAPPIDRAHDRFLHFLEVEVGRKLMLEDGDHDLARNHLADARPFVDATRSFHDDAGHIDLQRHEFLLRQFSVEKLKIPLGPEEDVVDLLLRLEPHQPDQLLLADHLDLHQDLAEEHAGLALHIHGLGELRLGQISVRHQELAEVFARVVGRGGNNAATLEEDLLLHGFVRQHEGTGLLSKAEPLEQIAGLHRLEVSGYAHSKGSKLYVFDKLRPMKTSSDLEIPIAFDESSLLERGFEPSRDLGHPGEFPYTRGPQASMYRGKLWTMRQYAGFSTASESNKRYRYLLERGTTGLSVAFDLPTQIGMDSDDALARGEVGKVGVAIDSIEDMELLLDQIPLDKVSISMTINAPASILLSLLLIVAERRGVPWSKLNGTIQNDILKEYAARGTYIFPPAPSMRIVTDIFEFCAKEVPRWNTISVSGYHIREAGSTAVQEVAFTLANGLQYVQAAVDRGLDVDTFAPRISFFFNAHNDFIEEIAKFRAARKLWAMMM